MSWTSARITGWLGAVLLVLGAAFHMTGLAMVRAGATDVSDPFLRAALEPIWVFPSVHWAAMALVAGFLAGREDGQSRLILGGVGTVVLIDAILMATSIGGFVGTYLLGVCGLLISFSAFLARA